MATFSVTDQTRRAQYTANGSTTEFSFSFQVNNTSDIKVDVNGTTKTESTHYDIKTTANSNGLNTDGTGKVVFRTSPSDHTPANNEIVTIYSDHPLSRTSVYTSGGNIAAASLENDFDTITMVLGSHEERMNRAIQAPVTDPVNVDLTLPIASTRASKIMGFDANGDFVVDSSSSLSLVFDTVTIGTILATNDLEFQPTGGQVNILGTSGQQRITFNNHSTPTIDIYQNSNITKLSVTNPTATRTIIFPDDTGVVALTSQLDLVNDTSPQLGGTLDLNGNRIEDNTQVLIKGSGSADIDLQAAGGQVNILDGSGNQRITFNNDGTPSINTFGAFSIDGDNTIDINSTGDFTVDSSGDIILDADGGEIYLKDGGTTKFTFRVSAAGNRILGDSATTIETSAGAVSFKPQLGYVDFLTNSGAQSIQLQSTTTPEIRFFQNSNTLDVEVATLSGTRTLTLPDATDTLVGKATTDTLTNKTLTSAVLNSSVSGTAIKDEDTMSSNSPNHLATQQSIKAYVDSRVATIPTGDITGVIAGTGMSGGGTSGTVTLNINATTGLTATSSTLSIDSTVVTKTGSHTLTNKTLTSPVLNTGVSGTAIKDEDDLVSNSATHLATQQSIKAYVDAQVAGGGAGNLSTVLGIGNTTGGNDIRITGGDSIIGLSGDMTIDVAGDLAIDADGGTIKFKDDGTHIGNIGNDSNNLIIEAKQSDKDIVFKGSDGGAGVNALTLDMSDAGSAYFNNKVGIGTSTPNALLELSSTDPILRFNDSNGGTDTKNFELRYVGTNSPDIDGLYFRTVNDANSVYSDKMVILGNGNVGIGLSNPDSYYAKDLVIGAANEGGITLVSGTTHNAYLAFADGTSGDARYRGQVFYLHNTDKMGFATAGSTRVQIDSSGLVGIGVAPTTSYGNSLQIHDTGTSGANLRLTDSTSGSGVNNGFELIQIGANNYIMNRENGFIATYTNTTERMRIDNSGRVMIGTTTEGNPAAENLTISDSGHAGITIRSTDSTSSRIYFSDATSGTGEYTGYLIYDHTTNKLHIATNSNEALQIDSSRNLLVGKTSTSVTSAGTIIQSNGSTWKIRDGSAPLFLKRLNSNGDIVNFYKDSTLIGDIGYIATGFYINGETDHSGWRFGQGGIAPMRNGADTDNTTDVGTAAARLDDVHATNGTIQTSDEREKQQIASLTDAEITAAKAISKLFKTFKWNDKVEAKGDAARTHTGVIAQQVEQTMTDAGLDAGNYAFFISSTWWEADGVNYDTQEAAPEGATENNRKGIRYPELLSFIGAATEQRLTSIESRLDALEAN